jgi:hypothetical protein
VWALKVGGISPVGRAHVEVNDGHLAHAGLTPRPRRRHRKVVEDGEARAVRTVSVVRAARHVASNAVA